MFVRRLMFSLMLLVVSVMVAPAQKVEQKPAARLGGRKFQEKFELTLER